MIQINFREVLGSAVRSQLGAINSGIRSSGSRPSENLSSILSGYSGNQRSTSNRAEDFLKNFFGGVFNSGSSSSSNGSGSVNQFYRDMREAGRDFRSASSRGIQRSRVHMPTVATQQETPRVRFTDAPNNYRFQQQAPTVASSSTLPSASPTPPSNRTGMQTVTPQQQTPTVLSAQAGSPTLQLRQPGAAPQFSLPGQGLAT